MIVAQFGHNFPPNPLAAYHFIVPCLNHTQLFGYRVPNSIKSIDIQDSFLRNSEGH